MSIPYREIRRLGWSSLCLLGLASLANAQSVPAPEISFTGSQSYVISYAGCAQCSADGIEERNGETGSWVYAGSGDQAYTDRAPGTYSYRVVYVFPVGRSGYSPVYGPAATVVVSESGNAGTESRPSLATQLAFGYSAASGDIDGDGRRDLLIRRQSQHAALQDGTIGNVLLKQDHQGNLHASTASQQVLSSAAGWPPANVEIRQRDVNIDGYADLILDGIESVGGFSRVRNQILFAPGSTPSGSTLSTRSVDDALVRFSRDIDRHLVDPDYYRNNAPLNYAAYVYFAVNCGWNLYNFPLDGYLPGGCYVEPQYFYVVYRDYSGFDADAMAIASTDYAMIHGTDSIDSGMAKIADTIGDRIGVAVGGWNVYDLLGDDDAELDEAEVLGIGLFSSLAGISDAVADEGDDGNSQTVAERVLLKGRRVLGRGPFHTALEFRNSTVSAYDSDPRVLFDGLLVSEVNWPRDHPSLTLRMGFVDGPASPPIYWGSLLTADGRYGDDLRYDLFPSMGQNGYNSNSYVSGLIKATFGIPTIEIESFVGGERPVPASEFR